MTGGMPCTCCSKPRQRRADGKGWEGAHERCSSCDSYWRNNGKDPAGPLHPSLRAKPGGNPTGTKRKEQWFEQPRQLKAPVAPAPDRGRLRSGAYGYRPSMGTAARAEAA